MTLNAGSLKTLTNQQTFKESPQEKKKGTQINKIRNERKEITTNNTETQRTIKYSRHNFMSRS